jgi:16S rRNA (guanine966-N2)-methyltransferase
MSLEILGGKYKGFSLPLSQKIGFRPTSVMLRRKFFDRFQEWEGIHFHDYCCGSGSMGIEALSRGSTSVHFYDVEKLHLDIVRKNVLLLQARYKDSPVTSMHKVTQKINLSFLGEVKELQHFIFIDPPYAQTEVYEQLVDGLKNFSPMGIAMETGSFKHFPVIWQKVADYFRSLSELHDNEDCAVGKLEHGDKCIWYFRRHHLQ